MLDGCSALTIKNRESASAIPIPVSSPKTGLSTFTPRVCQDFGKEVRANRNTLKTNVPNHTARWSVLREPEERVPSAHAARPSGPRSTPHRPTQPPHVTIQENRNGRDDARCAVDPIRTPHAPPTLYIYARTREDVWMLRSTFYVIRQGKM